MPTMLQVKTYILLKLPTIKTKIKNHTHVRKCESQNFFQAFTDELEKQIFIQKTVEGGQLKNKIILIFTMLHF